jgi:hypothetical protein
MLSGRQALLLGMAGLLLVLLGTPLAGIYAMDYRLAPTTVPQGYALPEGYETRAFDRDPFQPGNQTAHAVVYDSLPPETRTAVDRALAGDGPWYRTPADSPLPANPLVVYRDRARAVHLQTGYHWSSWRGKLPLVTLSAGLVCIAVAFRHRIREAGAVPGG